MITTEEAVKRLREATQAMAADENELVPNLDGMKPYKGPPPPKSPPVIRPSSKPRTSKTIFIDQSLICVRCGKGHFIQYWQYPTRHVECTNCGFQYIT